MAPSLPQGPDPVPVSDVVDASAVINRLQDSCWRVARTSTLERKMLWHRGISAAVRLAPITPAGAQGYDSALWLSDHRGIRAALCLATSCCSTCRCTEGSKQQFAWRSTTEQPEQQFPHCPPAEALKGSGQSLPSAHLQGHRRTRAAVCLARMRPAGACNTPLQGHLHAHICVGTSACMQRPAVHLALRALPRSSQRTAGSSLVGAQLQGHLHMHREQQHAWHLCFPLAAQV